MLAITQISITKKKIIHAYLVGIKISKINWDSIEKTFQISKQKE